MPSELEESFEQLPQRVRDVVYGKLSERAAIVEMLNAFSAASGRQLGTPDGRDPIADHIAALIAGGAHIPEEHRATVPSRDGPALVGLDEDERRHFGV